MAAKHLRVAAKFGPSAGLTAYMAAPISKQYPLYGELKAKRTEKSRLTHYCNTFGIKAGTPVAAVAAHVEDGAMAEFAEFKAFQAWKAGKVEAPVAAPKPITPTCFKVRGDAKKLDTTKYDTLTVAQTIEIIKAQYAAGAVYATVKAQTNSLKFLNIVNSSFTVMELYRLDLIVEAYSKLVPSTREVDTISPYDWGNIEWEDQ